MFVRCPYEISSIGSRAYSWDQSVARLMEYCDWLGQGHMSIPLTRSWGLMSGSSLGHRLGMRAACLREG